MKDYYQILEIAQNASQDDIKEQYRFLVHAWHPDKFPNSGQKLRAEEKIKEINEAYETLCNSAKRAEYDQTINAKRSSTTSNETVGEAKRRSDEERRKREEAENIRRKAEQKYADEERRRQEEAKRRADEEKKRRKETENLHKRSKQEKDTFLRYATEEPQRHEKTEQGLNWVNSKQSSWLIRVLVAFLIFVIVLFATVFNLLGSQTFMNRPVLSSTNPSPIQTLQQSSQIDVITTATVAPIHTSTSISPTTTQKTTFKDDFQDSATTSENWSPLGGTWVVENGALSCIVGGKYLANITVPEDFTFQLDIMGVNVIDKIIVFRAIDDSKHYGINFRTAPYNDIILVKSLPGNIGQIIQTVPFKNNNNTWYTVKVDVENNHIKVFVNDQPTIDFIDTLDPITDGTVGVGAMLQPGFSVVYYDNIVISHH